VSILSRPPLSARIEVDALSNITVLPLQSRNYQVSILLGLSSHWAAPVRCILDTGAGPNLVRRGVLPEVWERYRSREGPKTTIIGASGRRLRQRGLLTLQVSLGRLKTSAQFIVVDILAADCIIGCEFINKHVEAIFPKEKQVQLVEGGVARI
jgi:Retroviral aspartyl protease